MINLLDIDKAIFFKKMQQLDALCTREVEDVTVLIKEEKCHYPYKREKNVTVAVACLLSAWVPSSSGGGGSTRY